MYLAQRVVDGTLHYTISRSYRENGWWRSVDLIDLGGDPRVVVKAAGDGFVVEARIGAELRALGVEPTPGELEELFLPFVSASLQAAHQRRRQRRPRRPRRLPPAEKKRLEAEITLFDRRRLCYLSTGSPDLSAIGILPIQFFLPLADKSRDEIEQYLLFREQHLDPVDCRHYLFAVFNLRHWRLYLQARSMPPELDRSYLDQLFLDELCRINADARFWMREYPPRRLHPDLIRYATMFFDADWQWDAFREEDANREYTDHDRWSQRSEAAGVPGGQAEALFGRKVAELRAMSRKELVHLYKMRAQRFHPDHGGDPEKFVLLTRAYEALLKDSHER